MFGLIGKIVAISGKRDTLLQILLEASQGGMPGCRSYVIARDPSDADAIWVTEVWDDAASHRASLGLPAVQAAIARGRPLIADFAAQHITEPIGGYGLSAQA
jgi:quinol monooxygenase YgiN